MNDQILVYLNKFEYINFVNNLQKKIENKTNILDLRPSFCKIKSNYYKEEVLQLLKQHLPQALIKFKRVKAKHRKYTTIQERPNGSKIKT